MTPLGQIERPVGAGWLALLGGGDFSFGETLDADQAWVSKSAEGPVAFVPTASGSDDYGRHFAEYLRETFEREVFTVPVYRQRDAKRIKNCERLSEAAAIYLGAGVVDHLVEPLLGSPFVDALLQSLRRGATVVGIAAGAQSLGAVSRSLVGRHVVAGLQWLPGCVLETNFDPGHDRRLRELMKQPGARHGLGLPAESALLLGPEGEVESVGTIFALDDWDADYRVMSSVE